MNDRLQIGKGSNPFTLPLDLVTSTQAILARKRSGKSYTASVQAEELLKRQQQVIIVDPTSAWHGLRSSADGQGEGYPIVVFGGDHADAPLDWQAGKAMAAAVVDHGFSAIFDIGNLHTEEQVRFVMDLCSELLRINSTALHVFMDEADTFAPQKPLGLLQNKCLGTVTRLVKQGGIRGIGFTMITQRPASMNKDVLSQVDILTVLRMSHPLDIKAATDWIKTEVTVEFAKDVERALPGLPVGTAFFCSASLGLGERVEVRARRTFNSGATPKPGERKVEPTVLAKVDIAKLGQEISASVQRAQEDAPDFLKARVAELTAELANGGRVDMGFVEEAQALHKELEEMRERATAAETRALDAEVRFAEVDSKIGEVLDTIIRLFPDHLQEQGEVQATDAIKQFSVSKTVKAVSPSPTVKTKSSASLPVDGTLGSHSVNAPQMKILNAIATLHAIRGAVVTIEWIACTAGTTPRARGFEENMRQLKNMGLVEGIRLTAEGAKIARADATPALFQAVVRRLATSISGPQSEMLGILKSQKLSPAQLAAALNTTERSRGFEENVRQLKKRELIVLIGGRYSLVSWLEALA